MSFKTEEEIFLALLDKKKVGHIYWRSGNFIHFDGGSFIDQDGKSAMRNYCTKPPESWEIKDDPKPKVKRWQYVAKHNGALYPVRLDGFFKDDEQFLFFNNEEEIVFWIKDESSVREFDE